MPMPPPNGRRPRPRPCDSCPYRRDVPAGVWAASEYEKLPPYDNDTGDQPPGVFMCHQADGTVCAGWASVHGNRDNLALRLARAIDPEIDVGAVVAYRSPVPLFASGAEAAEHGLSGVPDPGPDADALMAKLRLQRERRRK